MLRKLAETLDKRHEKKSLQRLTTNFGHAMLSINASEDTVLRMWAGMSAREVYLAFIGRYPNIKDYASAPHSVRMAYLEEVKNHVLQLTKAEQAGKKDRGHTTGAILVNFWITALAWRAFEIADAMAEQLERQMGYPVDRLLPRE